MSSPSWADRRHHHVGGHSAAATLDAVFRHNKIMKKKNNLQVYELYAIIVFKWESFSQAISLSPPVYHKGVIAWKWRFAGNTCAWKLMLYRPIGKLFSALHLSSFLPCQSIFPVISATLCQSGTPPSVCCSLHTSFSELIFQVIFFLVISSILFSLFSQTLCMHQTARSTSTFNH